jgi:hypothetical protein
VARTGRRPGISGSREAIPAAARSSDAAGGLVVIGLTALVTLGLGKATPRRLRASGMMLW